MPLSPRPGYSTSNPPPDDSDPLALTAFNPFTSAGASPGANVTATVGATRYAMTNSVLTYSGATEFAIGSGVDLNFYESASLYPHNRWSQPFYAVEFYTDAAWFEFQCKYSTPDGAYRLIVDGRRVTNVAQTCYQGAPIGYAIQYRFDFGTSKPRRIRIELSNMPFNGIYVPSTATVWKVPAYRDRVLVLGDSITQGSLYNVGYGIGTWLHRTSLMMGWDDVWNQAIGGTGYTVAGGMKEFSRATGSVTGAVGNLNDIAQYNYPAGATQVIIFGGYNDRGVAVGTIKTAADTLYQNIKAAMPAARIIVIGCYAESGTPYSGITDTDTQLQACAAAAGLQFISPITGKVYNQRGTQIADHGAWITTANQSAYISVDGVHPNEAGNDYLARRIAAALQVLEESVTGVEPWAGGLHAALDDGRPSQDKEFLYLNGSTTLATMTPTALTATVARCWSYNCQFPIVVNRLRWFGIGATTTHRFAVYRQSDGVQVIGPISLTTTSDAWNSASIAAVTLAPNTAYICAISTTTTGTTAGLRTSGTPLLWPPLQASTPGGLALAIGDHRFWFGQFAVTAGVLPATLPTLVRGSGWTGGIPLFFFDSNSAA